MVPPMLCLLSACSLLAAHATSQAVNPQLVGTWTSKSRKVLTGPGFYDPRAQKIIEPEHTGISYSFTADGHYEEALFRAISNPVDPACPEAIVQWQHGTFVQAVNSSLSLTPIAVDGRQLMSQPCPQTTLFTRYDQNETFTNAQIEIDAYNNQLRLNLYGWDGTPVMPLWLAYTPPQMLPTTTLTPMSSTTAGASTGTAKLKKRVLGVEQEALQEKVLKPLARRKLTTHDCWFWLGLGSIFAGSIMYFCV